jgi:RNA-directed DNA polymerase
VITRDLVVDFHLKINNQFYKDYNNKSVKRIYIANLNSIRLKQIPRLSDDVIQKMFQLVIEPVVDVFGDFNSYGFRKHRSCKNAIGALANRLTKASENFTIIEMNLEKFFGKINQNWIKTHFPMPTGFENVLECWLNANLLESRDFYPNKYEIPESRIISCLVKNFTLDGLEAAAFRGVKRLVTIYNSNRKKKVLDLKFDLIRYTDNIVIVLNHPRNFKLIKKNVEEFLNIRGLQINGKKFKNIYFSLKKNKKGEPSTKFDFIGFTLMYQPNV